MEWYHCDEPGIIDVKNFDDGRFDKRANEHERYMKETGADIWNL